WPVHGRQRIGFLALVFDHPRDEVLDVLCAVAWRYYDRVGSPDDDEILDADCRHEPGLGPQIAIAGVFGDDIAFHRIAVLVLVAHFPQRIPGADIAPPHADRHDRGTPSVLHHRVIDRVAVAGGKRLTPQADEVAVALCGCQRIAAGGDHIGPK